MASSCQDQVRSSLALCAPTLACDLPAGPPNPGSHLIAHGLLLGHNDVFLAQRLL